MSKRMFVAWALLVTGTIAQAQGGVEQTLLDLEKQWAKAALASSGKAMEPLLAPGFAFLGSDGKMQTRAEFIANAKKSKLQVFANSDETVMVHGNTAIVAGVVTAKGTNQDGKAVDTRERFVDTWVKMPDGKWQCVAGAAVLLK